MVTALTSLLAAGLAVSLAAPGSFRGHTLPVQEVKESLEEMMQAILMGQGAQLESIEASIWQTFQSMPKNEVGHIGSRAVRYLVHNYFAKEHGWLIKGLEPHGNQENMSEVHDMSILQDKAPYLVESLLEAHRSDRGLSMAEATAMIATLERLIFDEAVLLLEASYHLNSLSLDEALNSSDLHEVMTSYLVLFEMGQRAVLDNKELHQALKARAAVVSTNWPLLVEFEEDTFHNYMYAKQKANPFQRPSLTFDNAVTIVQRLAHGYGKWQNIECQQMKRELMDLEEANGLIPIYKFYSQPESADYHFTETQEYLEKVGALQRTGRGDAYVRIANYMTGPSNCIASSSYYSVCCLNECEVLMNELESKILAPSATPERLLSLAENMSSATVDAPRKLSLVMEEKLQDIATRHGGAVPLHGRLFAQWMHHAFPRECPYPHITESQVLAPSHWQNGKAIVSSKKRTELADTLPAAPLLDDMKTLSWSDEEMLVTEKPKSSNRTLRWVMQAALIMGLLHTLLRSVQAVPFPTTDLKGKTSELPF